MLLLCPNVCWLTLLEGAMEGIAAPHLVIFTFIFSSGLTQKIPSFNDITYSSTHCGLLSGCMAFGTLMPAKKMPVISVNFGLFMLLTILFPGQGGTPWVWICQLINASSFLIHHNTALTHTVHPDSFTVRISSQEPKFLKLHWFFLKTKLFSSQLQLTWQWDHVFTDSISPIWCF